MAEVIGGATQRLFVAVVPPDHVRTLIVAGRAPAYDVAPELTWTRPEGWHVTLAFLGEVAGGDVEAVTTVVGSVAAATPAIEAQLTAAAAPDGRVLWLAVEDDPRGALAGLGDRLQTALADAALPVRRGAVRPHLTLARAARGRRVDEEVVASVAPVRVAWEADHLVVLRSVLGDGPARYVPVAAASLGAGPSEGAPPTAAPEVDGELPS